MIELSKLELWKVYQDASGKPLRILYDNEKVDTIEIEGKTFLGVCYLTNTPDAQWKSYLALDDIHERPAGV